MQFSFIIPVYNTGNLLKKCIYSIVKTSFGSFEIIVINDGSTDDSLVIIEELAAQYPCIRILDQVNQGQGAARNSGVRMARGDYIWFVDSDDWLFEGAVRRIEGVVSKHSPDVVVLSYATITEDGNHHPASNTPQNFLEKIWTPSKNEHLFSLVSCWCAPPWRLVCRRELLLQKQIVFAEGVFFEDHPFAIQLMLEAERVFIDPSLSYAYFQRANSTTKQNDHKAFDFLRIRRTCLDLLKRYGVFSGFQNISIGYIAPLEFFQAHVPAPLRKEFATRLGKDIQPDEIALLQNCRSGYSRYFDFVQKAIAGDEPEVSSVAVSRARLFLTPSGRRRIAQSIKRRTLNKMRTVFKKLQAKKTALRQLVDTSHAPSSYYQLGVGTRLENARVEVRGAAEARSYLTVGDYSLVGGNYVFERGIGAVTIGNKSSVGHNCFVICTQPGGIYIGNEVLISWDVTIIDSNSHSLDPELRAEDAFNWLAGVETGQIGIFKSWDNVESAPIRIEDRAWIGFGVTILKGVTIGKGAIVAAKSVVTKDVAPFTVVGGNPAKFISYVPRKKWDWEETLGAVHGDPAMIDLLKDSYLYRDHTNSLGLYLKSQEFRDLKEIILNHCQKSVKLLDVGAGNGVVAACFALQGFDVMAIELGDGAIGGVEGIKTVAECASRLDDKVGSRLKWAQADILAYQTSDTFDAILCRQALHHFAEPYRSVKKIADLLKPGGIALFVREHVIFDEDDKQLFLKAHPLNKFYGGENAYKVDEYVDFIEQSGLVVQKIYHFRESPINYEPHTNETILTLEEKDIAGRPYTFVAVKPES